MITYNHDHENERILFATTNFRNQMRRFGIMTDDRRRHMYIIGKTGTGKTTLQENMFMADVLAGHGCCYIDPHGDTAEKLLDYIPSWRINDVVYFNPADQDFPVGFNILETAREEQKHLVASGLMGVFKKIWPDVWSARMEYILLNCVLALLDYPGATLLGISRILVDKDYRARVIAKIRNPIVKTFWVAEFASWSEKYAAEAIPPVLNKVGQFLSASIIRNIVAQVNSTINPRQIMDEGKILIVNLSKGKIGEDNMRLLGGMMITKLQLSAMERVDIKHEDDRRDFYMYVDEFQNFANESFASILSEARKYRLNLTVAHQYIAQLSEEVAKAVFGNVGTLLVMRVGAEDAAALETEFAPVFTPEDLVNLPKYHMYLKLMVDGMATQPFSATTLPPIAQRTGSEAKVIAVSRERYAVPREQIEEKVLRWSGIELGADGIAGTPDDVGISYPQIVTEEEKEKLDYVNLQPPEPAAEVKAEEGEEGEVKEYLRISPERLAAIKPPSVGGKKEKPKFPHTCTRCGKVWEMPVKLDPSRPMYCAECLPLIRDEKKLKKDVIKAAFKEPLPPEEETKVEPPRPDKRNAPRIVGDIKLPQEPRSLPRQEPRRDSRPPKKYAQPQARSGQGAKASLLKDLEMAKGKLETNKKKLEASKPQAPKPKSDASPFKPMQPGEAITFDDL